VHDAVKEHARTPFREEVWKQLCQGFRFVQGDFNDDEAFRNLARTIAELDESRGTGGNHAFYLSVPPSAFPLVVQQLKEHCLADSPPGSWRRVVIEKPFGHDLASAQELQRVVGEVFPTNSVFRIDHYLGKETSRTSWRCASPNSMFEPVWNRSYVDHVQITMAEDIGIGGRAGYYDGIGAARDVIQNHLLQLLALTRWRSRSPSTPPTCARRSSRCSPPSCSPTTSRPHRPRAVRRRLAGRGEGPGYLEEEGIPADSRPRPTRP
jgi:glucose-6-phosphate 1-dehydrogenase